KRMIEKFFYKILCPISPQTRPARKQLPAVFGTQPATVLYAAMPRACAFAKASAHRCACRSCSCLLPPASCVLPPAFCLPPPASCVLPPASCLLIHPPLDAIESRATFFP